MLRMIALAAVLIVAALAIAHFVFRPPSLKDRTVTSAVEASPSTPLGRMASPPLEADGASGASLLIDGLDAFAARVALIRGAEVALDVQYYIWQRDATGLILLDELRKAAERGVRVRLLLDDNGISGLDDDLAALNALPNIEVRLFNPFIFRAIKPLGFVFDFVRLNRRMHNKSLTADGALSILGGRNIGDIYFGFGGGVQFIDTDVAVVGPAAADIGADFDRYWQSNSSHPVERIVRPESDNALNRLIADAQEAIGSPEGRLYYERLRNSNLVSQIQTGEVTFEWTDIVLVSDDPAKAMGDAEDKDMLFPQLMALLAGPSQSVDLVSAYFIPGKQFTEALAELSRAGARVRVLTNSFAATDVVIVHSAYVKYRPRLLEAGVELYELKPEYSPEDEPEILDLVGSSRGSLHSKTLSVDEEQIFIGSFNFDPRSAFLNTEMGVLIDSPTMASALATAFSERFDSVSYVPELTEDGGMIWGDGEIEGTPTTHRSEPQTTIVSRFMLWFLGLLPIEWLL